jgi:hypothetical protein
VTFPDAETLCSEEELAEAETLYVNEFTTSDPGNHLVTWYVEGVEVGSWSFRMEPKPVPVPPVVPPVTPPAVAAPAPASPPVAVLPAGPRPACVQAEGKVAKLTRKLKAAKVAKRKATLRGELKTARAARAQAC